MATQKRFPWPAAHQCPHGHIPSRQGYDGSGVADVNLTLRPLELTDASAITLAIANWDVSQWLSAVPYPYTIDDAEYFITQIVLKDTIWAIDNETSLIVVIGVKPDLGYWLRGDLHGKG